MPSLAPRIAACAAIPLVLGAAPASAHASPVTGATPGVTAHMLFDDTAGPWRAGIPMGGRPQPLRARRSGVRDPLPGSRRTAVSAAATAPDPEVLGFAQAGEVTSGAWRSDLDMSLLTTIAYFGVNMNGDGSMVTTDSGYQGWLSAQATALVNAAHSSGDRVVLTVKAFSSAAIAGIVESQQNSQAAIANIVAQVANRDVDGVNVDFEGGSGADSSHFTAFVAALRTALRSNLPQQSYVTVDTYASAPSGGTLYDIAGLGGAADAIDVMAYDITSPSSSTAGPVAPLNGMTYADTNTVASYLRLVPASQLILGVPYYGYKWSTTSNQPRAPTTGPAGADTYSAAVADFACAQQLTQNWDPTFASPWASWFSPASGDPCGGNHNSWRELYYENAQSLGAKYDLVNANQLRGIGIWALGYDSGHRDLWDEIATKFTVAHAPTPQVASLPATEDSRAFTVTWSVPSGSPSVDHYVLDVEDGSTGWLPWTQTTATSATVDGLPGHQYSFYVEAFTAAGYNSGAPGSAPMATTTVSAGAPQVEPFAGLYAVDGFGALHPGSSAPLPPAAPFPGWDIVRGLTLEPSGQGGVVLDGWGGLHPVGDAPAAQGSAYWPGWDIARGAAAAGSGGYVLDGWGGVHPFALGSGGPPPAPQGAAYWPGWDVARAIVTLADGSGGLVLDGYGGVHPFAAGGAVTAPVLSAYWSGWDIARGIALLPGSTGSSYAGYVLDGWGGLHPFASTGRALPSTPAPSGYWRGYDIARGVAVLGSGAGGYVVDGFGAFWPFGSAPPVDAPNYGAGAATVRALAAA